MTALLAALAVGGTIAGVVGVTMAGGDGSRVTAGGPVAADGRLPGGAPGASPGVGAGDMSPDHSPPVPGPDAVSGGTAGGHATPTASPTAAGHVSGKPAEGSSGAAGDASGKTGRTSGGADEGSSGSGPNSRTTSGSGTGASSGAAGSTGTAGSAGSTGGASATGGSGGSEGSGGSGGSGDTDAGSGAGADEDRVLSLVNRERATSGCSPLKRDAALRALARAHSADMAERGYFDHDTPEGVTPWARAERAGVANLGAENIARGQKTPEAVMRAWMNSPGHRANILDCGLRTLGVGVHEGPGGPWWTQEFGR